MRVTRAGLMVLGVLIGGYGAWLLWEGSSSEDRISAGVWLLGGVIVHDVLISAAVIGLGLVATRLLPAAARAPSAIALIIVGPLTLIALPMMGGFGAKDDNPTLLDRPYVTSWVALLVFSVVLVIVASLLRARSGDEAHGDPHHEPRDTPHHS